jgi:hypothetical protein
MQVSRTVHVAVQEVKKLACRAILGDLEKVSLLNGCSRLGICNLQDKE